MADMITINLNVFERRFLVELSKHGNRQTMDTRLLKANTIFALIDLEKKGAIRIEPTLELFRSEYVLTSIGINLVDLIKKDTTNA